MKNAESAFTLIELMVVAVIAIPASIALASIRARLVRDQIAEAAKAPVAALRAVAPPR